MKKVKLFNKFLNENLNEAKFSRGLFKGFEKVKNKVAIPFNKASDYNIDNQSMAYFSMMVIFAFNNQLGDLKMRHDSFMTWIIDDKIVVLLSPKAKSLLTFKIKDKGYFTLDDFISRLGAAVDTVLKQDKYIKTI
jgi:hypothetical protein